jgi:hypothetical protein
MELVFEWDPRKDQANWTKQGNLGFRRSPGPDLCGRRAFCRRATRDHHRPFAVEAAPARMFQQTGGWAGPDHQYPARNEEGTARL